jgi:hypothetical protein
MHRYSGHDQAHRSQSLDPNAAHGTPMDYF